MLAQEGKKDEETMTDIEAAHFSPHLGAPVRAALPEICITPARGATSRTRCAHFWPLPAPNSRRKTPAKIAYFFARDKVNNAFTLTHTLIRENRAHISFFFVSFHAR